MLECEACQLGKYHHNSFASSNESRQSSPFNIVHSNIGIRQEQRVLGFSILLFLLMIFHV